MAARKTTEDFIARATAKHNGRYSYELVEYKKSIEKVTVTCKEHGSFDVTPNNHLNGSNCPACKKGAMSKVFRKDNSTFIEQAKETHGEKYDYTKTVYDGVSESLTITCRVHGDFKQLPNHHINGSGCAKCSFESSATARAIGKDGFIERAREVHGDTYEYDDVVYTNFVGKVDISCKTHGNFNMSAQSHLIGQGCPACSVAAAQEDFISKAQELHGDKYGYSEVVYEGVLQPVKILCKEHGEFMQLPYVHLRGSGCRSCAVCGFNPSLSGALYVLSCGDMTKIGITNKSTSSRAKRISGSFGRKFTLLKEIKFDDGQECSDMETKLLRMLRARYSGPANRFNDYTETFMDVDLSWLFKQIEMLG